MPLGAVAAAAAGSLVSAGVGALTKGSGQSGAISAGQEQANAAQQAAYEQGRTDLNPFLTTGTNTLNQQNALLGLAGPDAASQAMSTFQQSPSYLYQMGEGLKAVDAGAAAKGLLRSGATLKAEQTFGQNLASQDFNTYFGRLNDLTKLGQQSGTSLLQAGTQTGAGIASTDTSAAAGQAGIYGDTVNGLTNAAGSAIKNGAYLAGTNGLFGAASDPYGNAGYSTAASSPSLFGG